MSSRSRPSDQPTSAPAPANTRAIRTLGQSGDCATNAASGTGSPTSSHVSGAERGSTAATTNDGDHQQPGGHPGGIVPGRSVHGGDEAARAEGDAEHGQPSDEVGRADPGRPAPAGGGHVSRGRCTRAGR